METFPANRGKEELGSPHRPYTAPAPACGGGGESPKLKIIPSPIFSLQGLRFFTEGKECRWFLFCGSGLLWGLKTLAREKWGYYREGLLGF